MNDRREEFMKHIRNVEEKVAKEGKEIDTGNLLIAWRLLENESIRKEEKNENEGLEK